MDKTLFTLFLLVCAPILCAQELYAPLPIDQEEKLMHTIAVEAPDDAIENLFVGALMKGLGNSVSDIRMMKELDEYPDLIFLIEPDKARVEEAIGCFSIPVVVTLAGDTAETVEGCLEIKAATYEDAAGKAAALIKEMYYQGMQPVYSTIFENGKDGYNVYRIPSLVALPGGHVVAFAETRTTELSDCAENDIVAKISTDGGRSWGELICVAESDASSLNNPTAVYIAEMNRILMLFQEYPPKQNEGSANTGVEGEGICRIYTVFSDDGGRTWSPKAEITRQAKLPAVTGFAFGPGVAIRVVSGPDKGRILVPANASGGEGGWFNYLVYSDDAGESWGILPGQSSYGTNESQIIQVSDTGFCFNARCHRFPGDELKAPEGWNPWNFSKVTRFRAMIPVDIKGTETRWNTTQIRTDMPDPLCQGAIYRYSGLVEGEKSRVLFSNPASQLTVPRPDRVYQTTPPMRMNGTVRLSYDNGQTWAYSKRIYGGRYTEFQYSVLANLGDGKIGCIFEAFPEVRFAVFDLEWLTSGQDKGDRD